MCLWKVPNRPIRRPMFQRLKCHYQGVRSVTDTCTCRHTCNTNVHIQCEVMCDNTDVRKVNFVLSKVQMSRCGQIDILWPEVWRLCFHGYIISQVCPLDMFVFKYIGLRNFHRCMCLLCMWHGLGITCSPAEFCWNGSWYTAVMVLCFPSKVPSLLASHSHTNAVCRQCTYSASYGLWRKSLKWQLRYCSIGSLFCS